MPKIRLYTCAECGVERYAGKTCDCGSEDLTLSFEHFESMIARRAPDTDVECAACETNLMGEDVQAYQHEGGWKFGGADMPLPRMRWWLSIKCPNCTYETSFSKFGVEKSIETTEMPSVDKWTEELWKEQREFKVPKWTRETATEAVIDMAKSDGKPGDLTTGICKALDISFEHFLRFSMLDEKGQKRVVQGLALALLTKKHGHCSQ